MSKSELIEFDSCPECLGMDLVTRYIGDDSGGLPIYEVTCRDCYASWESD